MTRKTRWIAGISAAVVVVAAGAGFALWQVLAGDAPPPVALTSLPPSSASSASGSASSAGDGADGTWTIDAASGSLADGSSTYAGYRVQEELSGIGANTAVGRTQNVTGSMTIDGTTITDLEITVDMTTLASDDDRRDNSLRSGDSRPASSRRPPSPSRSRSRSATCPRTVRRSRSPPSAT
jgi:polyisoprenoid-binding protein YceI